MSHARFVVSCAVLGLLVSACTTPGGGEGAAAPPATTAASIPAAAGAAGPAALGRPAPDFTLTDLDGKTVRLADHRGKIVVLEWFNPGCPFVKQAHGKGSLKEMARRQAERGVVWLAINSGSPGKQGHGIEVNAKGRDDWAMAHPILIDEKGDVGRLYDAKRTPHMYVIDAQGTLVYKGAIDNAPDGDPTEGDKVVNYVELALADLAAGRPVAKSETEAYGCSVKY